MKPSEVEARFQDLVDGHLSEKEAAEIQHEIDTSSHLHASFRAFLRVLEIERGVSNQRYELNPNFTVKVMTALNEKEQRSLLWRIFEMFSLDRRQVIGLATTCVLVSLGLYQWRHGSSVIIQQPVESKSSADTTLLSDSLQKNEHVALPPAVTGNIQSGAGASTASNPNDKDDARSRKVEQASNLAPPAKPGTKPNSIQVEAQIKKSEKRKVQEMQFDHGQVIQEESADTGAFGQRRDEESQLKKKDLKQDSLERYNEKLRQAAPAADPNNVATVKRSMDEGRLMAANTATDNESYIASIENKPLTPQEQPVSTFSIDVDTGSYTNARRFLQQGILPPPASVRVEEFLNYFDYDYPEQSENPFALSYEIAPSPLDPGKFLLRLALASKAVTRSDKPWNLVFLVDVSGSMADPNKLDLVKRSLPILVNGMSAQDSISLVTYAGDAGVVLDGGHGSEKSRVTSAIESLGAGGSTHGSGGIVAAYETAQKHFIAGSVNRIILVTDGDFNVGTTSVDELKRMIEEKRKSGITLTTIGVGTGNLKDGLMEQLADVGNGAYFYLDSFKEARKVFETDLVANMEIVAKDVKLQVEFNPQQVAQYRLIGYENRILKREDFDNDQIDAGEIGAGHKVTALYELVLANTDEAKRISGGDLRYQAPTPTPQPVKESQFPSEIGFLKIRFKQPASSTSQLESFPLQRSVVKDTAAQASTDFRFAASVGYFGEALRASSVAKIHSFDEIEKLASANVGEDRNGYRKEFVELVRNARSLRR